MLRSWQTWPILAASTIGMRTRGHVQIADTFYHSGKDFL
jgi:hypothetical protein